MSEEYLVFIYLDGKNPAPMFYGHAKEPCVNDIAEDLGSLPRIAKVAKISTSQAARAPEVERVLREITGNLSIALRSGGYGDLKRQAEWAVAFARNVLPSTEEKCPECGGSGKERMPAVMDCDTCGGTGKKE